MKELQDLVKSFDDACRFANLMDDAGFSISNITELDDKDVFVRDFLQYSLIDKLKPPVEQYAYKIAMFYSDILDESLMLLYSELNRGQMKFPGRLRSPYGVVLLPSKR